METVVKRQESAGLSRAAWVAIGLVVGLLIAIPIVLMLTAPSYHGTLYDDPPLVADFELPRADGGTFRLSDYRGQVVLLYFGYTSCPDICPATLLDLTRTLEQMGGKPQDLQVVFITIDPARDSAEKVGDYLSYFDPSIIGLVGGQSDLQPVMDRFGISAVTQDADESTAGYFVGHTSSMFVINREGRLRLRMHYGQPVPDLVSDLENVLQE